MAENENVMVLDERATIPTKKEVTAAAEKFVERVTEGWVNPLLAYGQIIAMQQMLSEAKDLIEESAMNEAEKYEGKSFSAYGMDVQIKETGVKYDYSANEYWQQLKEMVDAAKADLAGHETTLKKLSQYSKSSKTSLSITLRK